MLRKLWILYWRDWVQARSYRLAFLTRFASAAFPLALLVFVARLFAGVELEGISRYGGDYVAFTLLGGTVMTFSLTALRAFSNGLRQAQVTGTLETLLITKASPATIIFGWALYPYAQATLQLIVSIAGGFLVLGLGLQSVNVAATVVTLVLSVAVMASLGLLTASFTLVFKQGDPFTGAITAGSALLSGAMYPVDVLPHWMQWLAVMLPQTHSLEAMRLALLQDHSVGQLAAPLGALALYTALLLPTALVVLRLALHRARVVGSLAHY